MKLLTKGESSFLALSFAILILFLGMQNTFAEVGGPYAVDDNTMLLLHFDGNLTNETTKSSDGEFHGDESNFFFLSNWTMSED